MNGVRFECTHRRKRRHAGLEEVSLHLAGSLGAHPGDEERPLCGRSKVRPAALVDAIPKVQAGTLDVLPALGVDEEGNQERTHEGDEVETLRLGEQIRHLETDEADLQGGQEELQEDEGTVLVSNVVSDLKALLVQEQDLDETLQLLSSTLRRQVNHSVFGYLEDGTHVVSKKEEQSVHAKSHGDL